MNIFELLWIDLAADERGWTQMKTEGPRQHPLTFQHPALLGLPKKERGRLLSRCWNVVVKQFGVGRLIGLFVVLTIVTSIIVRILLAPTRLTGTLLSVIAGGANIIPYLILLRGMRTRIVRTALKELGGYCLQCGYDLRATSTTCPECGAPIPPSVAKSS